jgi:hypothetical protein
MEKIGSPRSTVWVLAAAFLGCLSLGTSAASDRRLDMIAALPATSPHASLGNESKTLGRVVGTWDVEYLDYLKDGTASHRTGEFIVGWVLDGRAVQDLWIVDPTAAGKEREVYTTLYYFEPQSRSWHATFVDPEHASVMSFSGGAVGNDRFVLETQDTNNKTTRWSFNEVRADSFIWRDEQSSDGGQTWKLKSEYHMKRHRDSHLGSDREAGPHGRWLSF